MPEPKFEIFVGKTKITVTASELTGAQIKELAGVPAGDALEEYVKDHELISINDGQTVEIKSGLHFRVHPGGQDS